MIRKMAIVGKSCINKIVIGTAGIAISRKQDRKYFRTLDREIFYEIELRLINFDKIIGYRLTK